MMMNEIEKARALQDFIDGHEWEGFAYFGGKRPDISPAAIDANPRALASHEWGESWEDFLFANNIILEAGEWIDCGK